MKGIITLFFAVSLATVGISQNIVTTSATNRVAIIEEFTGTSCPQCPAGHAVLDGILNANPVSVFAVGYSPTNSSLTGPYAGGLDLRRSFPDPFYSNPYYGNGDGRSMPTAHINRTKYSGSRKSSSSTWSSRANGIKSQASPVNLGLASSYDAMANQIDVTVEVYFTSNVTGPVYLTVLLMEGNIITTQSGASGNYTHKHVFRENLQNGQWGDVLTGTTNSGDLTTMNFSFDNSSSNYVINNCDILAFVSTGLDDNSEIITGFQVHANGGSGSVASGAATDELSLNDNDVRLFPNPASEELFIALNEKSNGSTVSISSITGEVIFSEDVVTNSNTVKRYSIEELGLASGSYFITVDGSAGKVTKKFIVK